MTTKIITTSSTKQFSAHMCKYLGVGLISGSIVHAGTLGGDYAKYVVLIILGIALFIIGNLLEHGISSLKELLPYIAISTVLSIGTGMVSGGTQHYLDGPNVAAILFPLGFFLAYLAFIYRDFKNELSTKKIATVAIISVLLFIILTYVAGKLPEQGGGHHDSAEGVHEH
jgi:hypothetical protein